MTIRWLLLAGLAVSLVGTASPAGAQGCEDAEAETFVENAGVRAALFNNGALFWDGGDHMYEVPKGSGTNAVFTTSVWIGGTVDGDVRFAGTNYGPYEYWPGPLDAEGEADPDLCAAYDRIWRVTLEDIARYNETSVASDDLADWPHEVGAPVVDGNGDPDDYDLAAGDRPPILGDETAWWVMNDRGGPHAWGRTLPIGLEARVTVSTVSDAYAQRRIGLLPDLAGVFHTATLYRYTLTYRGDTPFEDAYFGLYVDPDLGDGSDDFVGSYPEGEIGFVYNGDDFDGGALGYGRTPPALGVRMISGPGPKPMAGFLYHTGSGGVLGEPNGAADAYRYLQSRWRDGSPVTYGGIGYRSGEPTPFMFSDLPPGYWSEVDIDGLGTSNLPSDRRFVISHGPFCMDPGETVEITFAFVFSRSDVGHLASARQLAVTDAPRLAAIARVLGPDRDLATITLRDLPTPPPGLPDIPEPPTRYAVAEATWPNPATGEATLRLDLPRAAHVRLVLYDALGRRLATPVDETMGAAEHRLPVPTGALPPGVILYRLSVTPEGQSAIHATGRFVVTR